MAWPIVPSKLSSSLRPQNPESSSQSCRVAYQRASCPDPFLHLPRSTRTTSTETLSGCANNIGLGWVSRSLLQAGERNPHDKTAERKTRGKRVRLACKGAGGRGRVGRIEGPNPIRYRAVVAADCCRSLPLLPGERMERTKSALRGLDGPV